MLIPIVRSALCLRRSISSRQKSSALWRRYRQLPANSQPLLQLGAHTTPLLLAALAPSPAPRHTFQWQPSQLSPAHCCEHRVAPSAHCTDVLPACPTRAGRNLSGSYLLHLRDQHQQCACRQPRGVQSHRTHAHGRLRVLQALSSPSLQPSPAARASLFSPTSPVLRCTGLPRTLPVKVQPAAAAAGSVCVLHCDAAVCACVGDDGVQRPAASLRPSTLSRAQALTCEISAPTTAGTDGAVSEPLRATPSRPRALRAPLTLTRFANTTALLTPRSGVRDARVSFAGQHVPDQYSPRPCQPPAPPAGRRGHRAG